MTMQVIELDPAQVFLGDRLRAVDVEEVEKLAASFRERGQLSPIHVGEPNGEDGLYPLIAGAHRLAAAELLGVKVQAIVFTVEGDRARLHEIAENLHRYELTPFDQAAFVAEWREIFERLNGRVRRGKPAPGNSLNLRELSFWDETTEKFQLSRKTVERALTRFTKIDREAWEGLRGTAAARNASELDRLAALPAPEQRAVVRWLANPTMDVSSALRQVRGTVSPEIDEKKQFDAMVRRWKALSPKARGQFVDFLHERGDLVELIEHVLTQAGVEP